jgi:hypothetical protein
MDIEKAMNLVATSDVEHLLADSFLLNGRLVDLYLYPTELKILQKDKAQTIPIDFHLTFAIEHTPQGQVVLEFNHGKEHIELTREFWPRENEWEDMLLASIKRKDFH